MSINYLDTVTMYYDCPSDLRSYFTCHWIKDNRNKDKNFHCFCIKTEYAFIRYFPNLYGGKRLYVTFSLPKLYSHYNKNTFNIANYDNKTFMDILSKELNKVMNISILPKALSDWQPSRIDLFRMKQIKSVNRKEYLYGYGRLIYRGVTSKTYKNTTYLSSSKKAKRPNLILRTYDKTIEEHENTTKKSKHSNLILRTYNKTIEEQEKESYLEPTSILKKVSCPNLILRTYDKTIEEQDRESILDGNLPAMIEEEQETLMIESLVNSYDLEFYYYNDYRDSDSDLYRYEFSLRRNAVKRYCKKYNKTVNMKTIMSEDFQKTILNDLVMSRGLHYDILSKKDFRNAVSNIFPTEKSKKQALQLAESIRNKKPMPLKKHQEYRIRKKLNSHSINTATTNFVSIKGLDLL